MNTAITITTIICATIIFFFTIGFLNARENRSVKKKELEIRQLEIAAKLPEEVANLLTEAKKYGESNNNDN